MTDSHYPCGPDYAPTCAICWCSTHNSKRRPQPLGCGISYVCRLCRLDDFETRLRPELERILGGENYDTGIVPDAQTVQLILDVLDQKFGIR